MCQADKLVNVSNWEHGRLEIQKTFSLMSERLRIDRELLCAILKFETLKTIKSDSMDEQAGLGLGYDLTASLV